MGEIIKVTDCECDIPGACRRHNCRKTRHYWELCQTRRDYFALWEAGRGPGQHSYAPSAALKSMPAQPLRWTFGIIDTQASGDLDFCLASIHAAGWPDPVFYIDSNTPISESITARATVVREVGPPSRWRLFLRCLTDQLQRDPLSDALVIFSAVGDGPRGARDFLERDLWPSTQTGVVCYLVDSTIETDPAGPVTCEQLDETQLRNTSGWIFPRTAAEMLAAAPEADPNAPRNIGAFLKLVFDREGLEAYGYIGGICEAVQQSIDNYDPPDRFSAAGAIRRKNEDGG